MAGGWGTSGSRALLASAKVQAELDTVVGQARTPSLEDRERLPYTNAMLHKIQHFISMLPPMPSPTTPTCAVNSYPWCPPGVGILHRGRGAPLTKINRNKTLGTRNKVHFPLGF